MAQKARGDTEKECQWKNLLQRRPKQLLQRKDLRAYMTNIQKSEMLLQSRKTNNYFFFQVGVALELIDLNYSKGIWGLVVEKSLRMANNLSG